MKGPGRRGNRDTFKLPWPGGFPTIKGQRGIAFPPAHRDGRPEPYRRTSRPGGTFPTDLPALHA